MQIEETIKIEDLIKFPFPVQKNIGLWDVEYVVNNLKLDYYDMATDKFDPDLFQIKTIYNNPHDSDESSYRYLLFFKGEFACFYGYTGDRGTETVLFASMEKKLALRDYFLSLSADYDNESDIIGETINVSDSYTLFFQSTEGDFYYHIYNPYWSYCFHKDEPLYYIEDDNTLTPVTFVSFKLEGKDARDYSKKYKEENKFMIVKKMDSYKFEAPFKKIVFKVKNQNNN